ncbi:MAG TPA: FG-GAP repeat protein [Kofleriaceae bacterium]|nr:FG-GAP repeat protein [Kofleriaceae bacterium]
MITRNPGEPPPRTSSHAIDRRQRSIRRGPKTSCRYASAGPRIGRMSRVGAVPLGLVLFTVAACKFPYPGDVPGDAPGSLPTDAASSGRSLGGTVTGLWTGGVITLHLAAGAVDEDLPVDAGAPFTFAARVADGDSYLVTVADDGPDHDCALTNGSGRVNGSDVTDLAVTCTNLIPHGVAISAAVTFTFDPRVTHYPLPVSVLQQETSVTVTGASLTDATVADQAVTIGQPSSPVPIAPGAGVVPVVVRKGTLSQRYELAFDRGSIAIHEALYGRAADPGNGDEFGYALAAHGDYVAVGANGEDSSSAVGLDNNRTDSGAVTVFHRAGLTWTPTQFLKGSAITAGRQFGGAVALDGDVLVVGAPYDSGRATNAGAVYVFRLDGTSGSWVEEQRLTASDASAFDVFGAAVAASGDRLVVGSQHDIQPNDNVGQVYVFLWNGSTWSEEARLRPVSPQPDDVYGARVALDRDTLAVGYRTGHVLVYRRSGAAWNAETLPADTPASSFAIDGDTLAVGQSQDASGNGQPGDTSAPNAGAVRVFTRTGSSWNQSAYLKASTPRAQARVGNTVALRGDTIVTSDLGAKALLVFHKVGGDWVAEPPVIASGTPSAFGTLVAITGNGAVAAAGTDDGPDGALAHSGTAWFFR